MGIRVEDGNANSAQHVLQRNDHVDVQTGYARDGFVFCKCPPRIRSSVAQSEAHSIRTAACGREQSPERALHGQPIDPAHPLDGLGYGK
jgi:hypothetical protein